LCSRGEERRGEERRGAERRLLESALYPRVEWREFRGNFYTPTCCFLFLEISVDLSGNLWRESEFQNI